MSSGTATGCAKSCYAAIVESQTDVEIYQRSDGDCLHCLRLMADKHAAIVEFFRARLAQCGARRDEAPS